MSDSFAELFQASESKPLRRLKRGERIKATIVGLSNESIFLDIGGKSEGVLHATEMTDENSEVTAVIGDSIEVYYLQSKNGEQLFTISIGSGKNAEHLEEAFRSQIPVEGSVKEEIKGESSV